MEENKPNAFQQVFSKVQMKVIAAMVGGLLEEALKDHVGAPQLDNIVGSPYQQISTRP